MLRRTAKLGLIAGAMLSAALPAPADGAPVPFTPLARGPGMSISVYAFGPTVFVADTSADLAALVQLVEPQHARSLTAVDPRNSVLIAVFDRQHTTGGYWIDVREVAFVDDVCGIRAVQVTVELSGPGPGELVTLAFTRPFHVVAVARSAFDRTAPWSWILADASGERLASNSMPRTLDALRLARLSPDDPCLKPGRPRPF